MYHSLPPSLFLKSNSYDSSEVINKFSNFNWYWVAQHITGKLNSHIYIEFYRSSSSRRSGSVLQKSGVSSKKCSCMFLDKSSTSCRKSVTSIRSFGNDAGFLEWFLFIEILNASSTSFWIFLMILSSLNPLVSVVIKKKVLSK